MQGESRPSYARRIVLVVVAVCVGLVALGALMPSPQQREIAAKGRRLVSLKRVPVPPLPSNPAFRIPWPMVRSDNGMPGRAVTVHVYLRAGVRTSRADLLDQRYTAADVATGSTVLHIAFDRNWPDELRLVTAIAASSTPLSHRLLQDGFLLGRKPTGIPALVRAAERQVGVKRFEAARRAVLAELGDDSASAHSPGTVLYEAGGRYYLEPKLAGSGGGGASYPGYYNVYTTLEIMGDRRVELP